VLLKLLPPALLAAMLSPPLAAAPVEVLVQDPRGLALAEAVVYLESAQARSKVRPVQGVEVEQAARRFTQRVTVVPVGSQVEFPNRDKVRHHVFSFSPTKTFELKLYAGTPANPVLFDKPGVAVLGCNIHDQMVAWVLVVETPYYGISAAPGKVHLADVPPGSYQLRTWHPDLPPGAAPLEQTLVVPPGGASVSVRLPLGA
jgi:plastocyanin